MRQIAIHVLKMKLKDEKNTYTNFPILRFMNIYIYVQGELKKTGIGGCMANFGFFIVPNVMVWSPAYRKFNVFCGFSDFSNRP